MADTLREDRQVALRGRIERRVVHLSAALVKEMGMDPAAYVTRVALNALIVNPGISRIVRRRASTRRCCAASSRDCCRTASTVPSFRSRAPRRLIVMVDGRALLARRATPGLAMRARVVYDGEHWHP